MGTGDWIMATGQVRKMYELLPVPVLVVGEGRKPQWSEMFLHNNKIRKHISSQRTQILVNAPGMRPYIAGRNSVRWEWRVFNPTPGEIVFLRPESDWGLRGTGAIMVEPNVKKGNVNKEWPFQRWQQLVDRKAGSFVQCGPPGTRWLNGVTRIETPTFRHAAAVLSHARALVSAEGGLMHAAAALSIPAVILWSHFISPEITGYKMHKNIRHASAPCGLRVRCNHCIQSMAAITVEEVDQTLRGIL